MKPMGLTIACAGFLLLGGCGQSPQSSALQRATNNYQRAIQSGVQGKGYPGEFNRLFPGAENIISHYTGKMGTSQWNSSAGLFGRYVFAMQHTVVFDRARTNIVSTGTPSFYLYEITNITFRADGAPIFGGRQISTERFSVESWKKLVAAQGDFKAVGINLETNKPVENFEATWRRM